MTTRHNHQMHANNNNQFQNRKKKSKFSLFYSPVVRLSAFPLAHVRLSSSFSRFQCAMKLFCVELFTLFREHIKFEISFNISDTGNQSRMLIVSFESSIVCDICLAACICHKMRDKNTCATLSETGVWLVEPSDDERWW